MLFFLQVSENSNQQLRNLALDALDQSICAVLDSDQLRITKPSELELSSTGVSNIILPP